jgi:hypothetical protein
MIPNAGANTERHWSQILVPGELKGNPSADALSNPSEVREGSFRPSRQQGLRPGFSTDHPCGCGNLMGLGESHPLSSISTKTGYGSRQQYWHFSGWMELLGFDPTPIMTTNGIKYIEIEQAGR